MDTIGKPPPATTATAQQNYKDLRVWQHSRQLVKLIYLLTKDFPAEEKFGLTSQMRRAAIAVPSNVAEGSIRAIPFSF